MKDSRHKLEPDKIKLLPKIKFHDKPAKLVQPIKLFQKISLYDRLQQPDESSGS